MPNKCFSNRIHSVDWTKNVGKQIRKYLYNNIIIYVSILSIISITLICSVILFFASGKPFWATYWNLTISAFTYQSPNLESGVWINDLIKGVSSLIGIFVTGLVIGGISAVFIDIHRKRRSGMAIPMLVDHAVICGWNESGQKIVNTIRQESKNQDIVIVCNRNGCPAHGEKIFWIKGDFTDEDTLKRAFIKESQTAIILSDTDETNGNEDYADSRTVLAVLTIEKLNCKIHTAAELINPDKRKHLEKAGVDEIVIRGEISGSILSRISRNRGLSKLVTQLLNYGEGSEFYKILCPDSLKGKKFGESLRQMYEEKSCLLIGYEMQNGEIFITPKHESIINDPLYVYIISENAPSID